MDCEKRTITREMMLIENILREINVCEARYKRPDVITMSPDIFNKICKSVCDNFKSVGLYEYFTEQQYDNVYMFGIKVEVNSEWKNRIQLGFDLI